MHSGNRDTHAETYRQVRSGATKVLYMSPERLTKNLSVELQWLTDMHQKYVLINHLSLTSIFCIDAIFHHFLLFSSPAGPSSR
jgi:superfamily II DNA helicase RecQ